MQEEILLALALPKRKSAFIHTSTKYDVCKRFYEKDQREGKSSVLLEITVSEMGCGFVDISEPAAAAVWINDDCAIPGYDMSDILWRGRHWSEKNAEVLLLGRPRPESLKILCGHGRFDAGFKHAKDISAGVGGRAFLSAPPSAIEYPIASNAWIWRKLSVLSEYSGREKNSDATEWEGGYLAVRKGETVTALTEPSAGHFGNAFFWYIFGEDLNGSSGWLPTDIFS